MKRRYVIVLFVVHSLFLALPAAKASTYQYDNLHRLTQVTYSDGTRIVYTYDASGNRSQRVIAALSDFTVDGEVNFEDYAILAMEWLETGDDLTADIYPIGGDTIVNWSDLQVLADQWLGGN